MRRVRPIMPSRSKPLSRQRFPPPHPSFLVSVSLPLSVLEFQYLVCVLISSKHLREFCVASAPRGTLTVVAMAHAGPHQNAQAGETASSLRFCAFRSGLRRPSSGAARLLLGATVLVSAVPACSFLHAHEGPPRAAFVFHSPGRHGERRAACSPMPRSVPGYAASRMPVRSPAPPAVGLDRAARPAGWTCLFGGSVGGGFLPDDDAWGEDELWQSETGEEPGADWRTVLLRDEKLNRTIECFVDREIEVEGKEYVTLIPADTPVIMAGYKTVNGSQQLVPVLDDHTIGELFPTASAVLSEMDLLLTRSAVVLTVEEVEDSIDTSDSDEVDDDDDDDERVVVIDLGRGGEASLPLSMFEDDEDDSSEFDDEDVIPIAESDSGVIGLRRGELIDREAGKADSLPLSVSSLSICPLRRLAPAPPRSLLSERCA